MSYALWARIKQLEARRGLQERPVCPECGASDGGVIVFGTLREDGTVDYDDSPPCEGCDRVAAELGRINRIEFRDNTRPRAHERS